MSTAVPSLTEELLSAISRTNPCRIGIDGLDGVGKSTLASLLADHCQARCVPVDTFVANNQGAYVPYLDTEALRGAVGDDRIVVEGVCLLHALDEAHLSIDYLIYVQRMHLGLWADEEYLGLDQNLEEFLKKQRQVVAQFTGSDEPEPDDLGLAEEIIRYHHRYLPHQRADFVFKRGDS